MDKRVVVAYGPPMRRIILFFLLLLIATPARADGTLTFAYIDQPLSCGSLAVLKAAYARLGYNVETYKGPAARLLADSNAGLTDGEVHRIAAIAPNYHHLIRVDAQINTVEGVIVSCGKLPEIRTVDELGKYRVAVRIGNVYATDLTKDLPNVTRTPDADRMMEMLLGHRVDYILTDRSWITMQQQLPGRECLRVQEPPLVSIPLYHYLHIRHRELVPAITKVLREIVASGEAETIRRRATLNFSPALQ